jgi:hypothetical protein
MAPDPAVASEALPAADGPAAAPAPPAAVRPGRLTTLAVTGTLATVSIAVGASQVASPFTAKISGAWFFGIAPASGAGAGAAGADARFLGIVAVYAGLVVLLGSWYELVRTARRGPDVTARRLLPVLVAWEIPLVMVGPLFSRDVYSYAAQGRMLTRGIDPYRHGPSALGHGPFLALVDPLWRHATAPYGPLWVRLSEATVQLARHDALASVVGFRVVALVGTSLIAWGVASLAVAGEGRAGPAFAVGAMNPVVLLDLLAGAHNDALMLGLLVAACALARRHHIAAAVVVCALASSIKLPALIGVLFIGWFWARAGAPLSARLARSGAALAITGGLLAVIGLVSGLNWQFLGGLTNPGVVVSWLDPATAAGRGLANAAHALGWAAHTAVVVRVTRVVALSAAAAVAAWLFVRTRRGQEVVALGWSLLAFAVLGPVVWPWYETWGLVFLACAASVAATTNAGTSWVLRVVMVLTTIASFADIPHPGLLTGGDGALVWSCWGVLAAATAVFVVRRLVLPGRLASRLRPAALPTRPRRGLFGR